MLAVSGLGECKRTFGSDCKDRPERLEIFKVTFYILKIYRPNCYIIKIRKFVTFRDRLLNVSYTVAFLTFYKFRSILI